VESEDFVAETLLGHSNFHAFRRRQCYHRPIFVQDAKAREGAEEALVPHKKNAKLVFKKERGRKKNV